LIIFSWIVTRFSLSPLHHIIAKTSEVSSEKLNIRLDIEHLPYELKKLATSLNTMLARLEDSFQRLFDFSSDLAHELRTPISNMKIQTQVALMQSRTLEEYNSVLQSNVEELDQLAHMINDMLFLAKSENALILPHKELIALDHELHALFEFYEAFAEDRGITFVLNGQASLRGDKLMLRRALSNLITNAVTHGFTNTSVHVRLEHGSRGYIRVTISSQGETIAPEHLPRLFDRFYRMDSARQRSSDGVGLGLAITRSIIQAHGGSIVATSEHGLTEFHVTLPEA
jgi:two-component system heavy metal sensor histidine kinase CusS